VPAGEPKTIGRASHDLTCITPIQRTSLLHFDVCRPENLDFLKDLTVSLYVNEFHVAEHHGGDNWRLTFH